MVHIFAPTVGLCFSVELKLSYELAMFSKNHTQMACWFINSLHMVLHFQSPLRTSSFECFKELTLAYHRDKNGIFPLT